MLKKALTLFGLCALVSVAWSFYLDFQVAKTQALSSTPVIFTLKKGASLSDLSHILQAEQALSHPWYFKLCAKWQGADTRLKAGEYKLEPGMNMLDVLELITAGKVLQHAFTLVEGWTLHQVLEALRQEPKLNHVLDEAQLQAWQRAWKLPHLEGQFLPETYHFARNSSDTQILMRAHEALKQVLTAAWQTRQPDLPYQSPQDALILASIVERETSKVNEYPLVAGVYIRRLSKKMLLQADPTVVYGLGPEFSGQLRFRHLKQVGPYNTYLKSGLPPTPIAMPGRLAIQAALHPASGQALYFVADGLGGHVFSATLAEHNQAVARYRKRGISAAP